MACLSLKTLLNARLSVNLNRRILELEPLGRLSCLSVICCSELGMKHISDISILLEAHDKRERQKGNGLCSFFQTSPAPSYFSATNASQNESGFNEQPERTTQFRLETPRGKEGVLRICSAWGWISKSNYLSKSERALLEASELTLAADENQHCRNVCILSFWETSNSLPTSTYHPPLVSLMPALQALLAALRLSEDRSCSPDLPRTGGFYLKLKPPSPPQPSRKNVEKTQSWHFK